MPLSSPSTLRDAVNEFYYNMTVCELQSAHTDVLYQDISYHSMMVLDLIAYTDHCTVSALAKALHVSKSAVTMKVNELVRRGLVVKTQDHMDRRVHRLSVHPEVRQRSLAFDRMLERAEEQLRQVYSAQECEQFCRMLCDISTLLKGGSAHGTGSLSGNHLPLSV